MTVRNQTAALSILLSIICVVISPYAWSRSGYAEIHAKSRTLQEVQEGFDRNKAEIARVFASHPGLPAGRILIGLTIEPDGTVSECRVATSTFSNAGLETQLVQAIKKISFGARDVPSFSYAKYPIDYRPPDPKANLH